MNTHIVPTIERAESGSLVVTSETIAEGAGVEHRAVLQMIAKHETRIKRFGPLAFEMRQGSPLPQGGFAATTRVALLNEQQSTLIMSFMRNTEQVMDFKEALVDGFFKMAEQIQSQAPALPQSYSEALRELASTHEAKEAAEARAKELEAPANAWGIMVSAAGDYSVDEAAKILSRDDEITIGRNRLFEFMGQVGWIYRHGSRRAWHAYQPQVEIGRLTVRMSAAFLNAKTGEMENPAPTIRITAKGIEALRLALLPEVAA